MAERIERAYRDPHTPIEREIARLGPWFHNLHLPDGTQTAPDHPLGDFPSILWRKIEPLLPADLSGRKVLDIGCNAGFYCFELARRGADVTGIEPDPRYLAQARWAAERYGLADRIRFEEMRVYDLASRPEHYDVTLFMGVFYHLRYPLLALDIVARRTSWILVFQTLTLPEEERVDAPADVEFREREKLLAPGWPKMAFVERWFAGDPTNWWVPNPAGAEALLRSSGMRIQSHPAPELWLCHPDRGTSPVPDHDVAELGATAGRVPPEEGRPG